jgi:hypothetical protein
MTASDLFRAKALVLAYHRIMPSEPRFAACLIGVPPIKSLDDLHAVYDEVVKSGELEADGTAQAEDRETGETLDIARSLYRWRQPCCS